MKSFKVRAVLVCCLVLSACAAECKTVFVSQVGGSDTYGGLSWGAAKATVTAGINAAVSGDEVWVAKGLYLGRITLKNGVGLYGGFAGSESVRDQRDSKTNLTVLDGGQAGSVVTTVSSPASSTRIDGFTIRNGKANDCGGGIYCSGSSVTISNNIITSNTATGFNIGYGGGIYCTNSSLATITNNTITGNTATVGYGGGIYCYSSSNTITNNTITGNTAGTGGGIDCEYSSSPAISNNTITGNNAWNGAGISCEFSSSPAISYNIIASNTASDHSGGGILCEYSSSPTISNNIIASNTSIFEGAGVYSDSSSPTITNNTIAGNTSTYDDCGGVYYSGGSPVIANNIVAFNSSGIHADTSSTLKSNCVFGNTRYNYWSALSQGVGDIIADPRIVISASGILHIQPTSPCRNAGDSTAPGLPSMDIDGQTRPEGTGLDIGADESYGETWIPPVIHVAPSGNDSNDGSSWSLAKKTVKAGISASFPCQEVWVAAGTYVENITLRNYVGLYGGFAGTETSRDQRNWKANQTILDGNQAGNVVTSPSGATASTIIDGFTIRNGRSINNKGSVTDGTGIWCYSSSPTISNNIITGNANADSDGGGICCYFSAARIVDNIISLNTTQKGGGIYCYTSTPTIVNNVFDSNSAGAGDGGGIYLDMGSNASSGSPVLCNNTFVSNTASRGGGIYFNCSPAVLSNCIMAFNSSGICCYSCTPVLQYNCVYGNTAYDYSSNDSGVVLLPGKNDISLDPLFVDRANRDYHLAASSPCIDAGNNAFVQPDWLDIDGQARVMGGDVDMGADESDGTLMVPTPSFNPDGGPYTAPQTVIVTCLWPGATIRYTTNGADPTEADPMIASGGTVTVGNDTVVKARAWSSAAITSRVKSATYTFAAATPTFSPDGATYSSPKNVTISCSTPGAVVHYTTNGAEPTENDPTIDLASYILVDTNNCTIKAKAWKSGWAPSPTKSATYHFSVSAPTFSPSGGTYSQAQDVAIACATPGAMIHYTTNGTTPTEADPVLASGSTVHIARNTPLTAKAFRSGWNTSPNKYAEYVISGSGSIICVKPDGDDNNDGLSWSSAKKTVQGAASACVAGMDVWVAAGTYKGSTTLKNGVALYGGFTGTEVSRGQRNWTTNWTTLDGNHLATVVAVASGAAASTRIDGFRIRNGKTTDGAGGGINCQSCSPTIVNNAITGNDGAYGGGICSSGSPTVSNNVIVGNTGGGGIYCVNGSPTISNNTITGNSTGAYGCGGIYFQTYLSSYTLSLSNNIVAFNSSGVCQRGGTSALRNNCVFGNGSYNYSGLSSGTGDISADPLFVSRTSGNCHLTAASPCINAGWNDAPGIPALDFDGQKRIQGGKVDIGADEWWPGAGDAKKIASGSIGLSAISVSAAFPDFFYVENDDRSAGIRVDKPGHGFAAGVRVDLDGTPGTNADGERVITASSVTPSGFGSVAPLAVSNKTLGGGPFGLQQALWGWVPVHQPDNTTKPEWLPSVGLNNIGLLVRTWGRVTYSGDGFFYIDDGSALDDNSTHKGVKVYGSVPVAPGIDPVGRQVFVTGISSCEKPGSDPVRIIRTRWPEDVSLAGE